MWSISFFSLRKSSTSKLRLPNMLSFGTLAVIAIVIVPALFSFDFFFFRHYYSSNIPCVYTYKSNVCSQPLPIVCYRATPFHSDRMLWLVVWAAYFMLNPKCIEHLWKSGKRNTLEYYSCFNISLHQFVCSASTSCDELIFEVCALFAVCCGVCCCAPIIFDSDVCTRK